MKTFGISLIVVGLTLVAASAAAQGLTSFTLVGKDDQKWYIDGAGEANPEIEIAASAPITITVEQDGSVPHNLKVGDNPVSSELTEDGQGFTYTFTSPASGTLTYICQLHGTIMSGTMRVAGTPSNGDGEENGAPGLGLVGVLVALVGVALFVARRR